MPKQRTLKTKRETEGTLAETAYRLIEEMIVLRRLPPGTMVSENWLREELNCGRTPIREALQRLKYDGYIEVHARRGALVTTIDILRQLELLEVRRPLDNLTARLGSARATKAERVEMTQLADALCKAADKRDILRYLRVNRAVHELLAKAAHNRVLSQTLAITHGLSRRFWYSYIGESGSFRKAAELHSMVLRSIASGDAEEAATRANDLLDYLETLTRSAVDRHFVS